MGRIDIEVKIVIEKEEADRLVIGEDEWKTGRNLTTGRRREDKIVAYGTKWRLIFQVRSKEKDISRNKVMVS